MRRALAVWALLLAVYAAGLGLRAAPGEDLSAGEAHVLLTVQSVVRDGDLDLADDFGERAWREDFGGDLVPAAGPRDGRQLEPAGLLYVAIAAPAYAAGGRLAVQLLGAALLAAAFAAAVPAARRLVPDPWATAGVLVAALSPPAVLAATTVAPDPLAAALLAGAAALALRVREDAGGVLPVHAFWAAALVAAVPWAGVRFAAPAAVVAWATSRWLRRRRRGLAGLVVLEVVLFSAVTFVSVNDRLYGGPVPGAVLPPPGPTGADGLAAHLERWPRLLGLWLDRDVGLVRWAPAALLVLAAAVLLWRAHRERLVAALPQLAEVEVGAGFLLAVCAAQALAAAFLAPSIADPWPPAHLLVCVAPLGAAAAAPALRRLPRTGRALAALTLTATVWTLVAVRADGGAGVAPPQGPLPWGGLERVLPELR